MKSAKASEVITQFQIEPHSVQGEQVRVKMPVKSNFSVGMLYSLELLRRKYSTGNINANH
jgi:hypothetical protein